MSQYVTRFSHFTFKRDNDMLVVTSERDAGFEQVYEWKNEYDEYESKDELNSAIHSDYYLQVRRDYDEYTA